MKKPPFLQTGDVVGIVATARKITKSELQPALQTLTNWGLQFKLGHTIDASENQFAGDDELRRNDLQQMLDDPKVKAIWCARGGYGTVRLIDHLDFIKFEATPKWIIGYSDITVLHNHIHQLGIESLHAQMPLEIEKKSPETIQTLKNALFGIPYQNYGVNGEEANRPGKGSGLLVGGNLSVLYSLCGSRSSIDTRNKILFLEDLDEYLYHVDRMMQNLKRNGMLDDLAGLIVGGMTGMHDNTIPYGKSAEAIIAETVAGYGYPVCFNFPSGHGYENRALVLGSHVTLDVTDSSAIITYTDGISQ